MTFTLEDWHQRFEQQAGWTESLRAHIFSRAGIRSARRILEVGCGTGVITTSAAREYSSIKVIGVDIDIPRLRFGRSRDRISEYVGGDALRLPFGEEEFDLTFCHFLLLWVSEPEQALREMVRVTRRGGWVAAFAEPDHTARIDYPPSLAEFGRLQTISLQRQGADPEAGRKLAGLFSGAGLCLEECGVLESKFNPGGQAAADTELEMKVLREDLGEQISDIAWKIFAEADRAVRSCGRRVLFVPTFYAAGTRNPS
jgi:SAM-dependent methyltransferase